jgi:hypothetical protein
MASIENLLSEVARLEAEVARMKHDKVMAAMDFSDLYKNMLQDEWARIVDMGDTDENVLKSLDEAISVSNEAAAAFIDAHADELDDIGSLGDILQIGIYFWS